MLYGADIVLLDEFKYWDQISKAMEMNERVQEGVKRREWVKTCVRGDL